MSAKEETPTPASSSPDQLPTSSQDQPPTPAPKKKLPYIKPAFRMEKVFVTTALSCGKVTGSGNPLCTGNLSAS